MKANHSLFSLTVKMTVPVVQFHCLEDVISNRFYIKVWRGTMCKNCHWWEGKGISWKSMPGWQIILLLSILQIMRSEGHRDFSGWGFRKLHSKHFFSQFQYTISICTRCPVVWEFKLQQYEVCLSRETNMAISFFYDFDLPLKPTIWEAWYKALWDSLYVTDIE